MRIAFSNSYRALFQHAARAMLCEVPHRYYRITLVGHEWHVTRPHASLPHAFSGFDQAESFVRNDSGGTAVLVEIVVGNAYMVKSLVGPADVRWSSRRH